MMSPEIRRYPKAVQIALLSITAVSLLLIVSGFFYGGDVTLLSCVNLTLQCAFIVLLNRFPKSVLWLYAFFLTVSALAPFVSTIEYWGVWLTLLYAGLVLRVRYALLLAFSFSGLQFLSYAIYRDTSYTFLGVVSVTSLFFFFTFIGIGLRSFNLIQNQRVRILELERERAEQDSREWKDDLVAELHDALAGTLTDIALCSYQNQKETDPTVSTQGNALIHKLAMQSVQEIHQIIDIIDDDKPLKESVADTGQAANAARRYGKETIRKFLEAEDLKAQTIGMKGHSLIQGENDILLPKSLHHEMRLTLREIYTNIKKYAAPEGVYLVSVTISREGIAIYSSNRIEKGREKVLQHESGLKNIRQRVSKLNGTVKSWSDDDDLRMTIYFPVKGTRQNGHNHDGQ